MRTTCTFQHQHHTHTHSVLICVNLNSVELVTCEDLQNVLCVFIIIFYQFFSCQHIHHPKYSFSDIFNGYIKVRAWNSTSRLNKVTSFASEIFLTCLQAKQSVSAFRNILHNSPRMTNETKDLLEVIIKSGQLQINYVENIFKRLGKHQKRLSVDIFTEKYRYNIDV